MLHLVDAQFNICTDTDSADGEQLQVALLRIKNYEDVHYPMSMPELSKVLDGFTKFEAN